jgi:hypothetical protein
MPKSGVPLRGNLRVHVFKGLRLRVWLGELSRPLYSRLPLACELLRFGYLRRRHFPSEEIPEPTAYGVVTRCCRSSERPRRNRQTCPHGENYILRHVFTRSVSLPLLFFEAVDLAPGVPRRTSERAQTRAGAQTPNPLYGKQGAWVRRDPPVGGLLDSENCSCPLSQKPVQKRFAPERG